MKDHYTVLGVDRHATTAQIKRAYRKLVLQYHPDKLDPSADQEAANAKFIAVQEAYDHLQQETDTVDPMDRFYRIRQAQVVEKNTIKN